MNDFNRYYQYSAFVDAVVAVRVFYKQKTSPAFYAKTDDVIYPKFYFSVEMYSFKAAT